MPQGWDSSDTHPAMTPTCPTRGACRGLKPMSFHCTPTTNPPESHLVALRLHKRMVLAIWEKQGMISVSSRCPQLPSGL